MGAREEKIVLDFIAAYRDSWPADLEKALEPLSEDAYYQIVVPTIAPVHGRANVLAEHRLMQATGCEDQKHDMISYGSAGNTVFTERVDHSKRNGKWSKVPLVAVFEVDEAGKITAWREYLDLVNVSRSHGMSVDALVSSLKLAE
jgi:limonene-1,2-epoxide hydrolase